MSLSCLVHNYHKEILDMMQQMLLGLGGLPDPVYVDDVFKTQLYSGNSSSQSINNGIDLDGKGGLVWLKNRSTSTQYTQSSYHHWYDTNRLVGRRISSNNDDYQWNDSGSGITSFNSNGFSFSNNFFSNQNYVNYVSWTFRKQKGFFDVVTYTGDSSSANQTFNHSLDSVPGMVIIKNLSRASDWYVWVPDSIKTTEGTLNTDDDFGSQVIGTVTSTTVQTLYTNQTATNRNGDNYVCYLFGSDDARFGADRDESIIKVGSYNGNNSNRTINTGFKPGFVMIKTLTSTDNWVIFDNQRGTNELDANRTSVDDPASDKFGGFSSSGFNLVGGNGATNSSQTYMYMAIREGL